MEALERRGKLLAVAAIVFIVFWSQCKGVSAQRNNTKMSYVCPPEFIRLGHSCYYFSDKKATWREAIFLCSERDSNLTVPARWEDRNLREYLNRPQIDKARRWIGGMYDVGQQTWRWGSGLRKMHYQSFSKMKKMTPAELELHCISMEPDLLYRWAPRSCLDHQLYICKSKLRKIPKAAIKELHKRWGRMGVINEITVPSNSREVNDLRMVNDVTVNPYTNPKSYDLRPNPRLENKRHYTRKGGRNHQKGPKDMKKRRPSIMRRLKRPFPGYTWNRRDPEASYQHNADILRSGKTGLTPQQVNTHLARLQHLRDKQLRRRRIHEKDDWLVNNPKPALANTHARTYTVDNNISALHPKMIVEEFDMMPPPQPVTLPKPTGEDG